MFRNNLNIENLNAEAVTTLARSYNLLDYTPKLRGIITSVFGISDFNGITKYDLHQLINDTLLLKYKGESTLKSLLVEEFITRKVVAAFEIKVNSSRVDFLTINGDTQSFEIKSELDNLSKLHKQVSDYAKVFEYNHIVIDDKHYENALKIIPAEYGIWSLKNGKKITLRKPTKNAQLDASLQLNLFTKKELASYFTFNSGNANEILNYYTTSQINTTFKLMLKKRYYKRWNFLINNKQDILPIDYQFFFNSNINPKDIYNC
ncbi:MAG: sce7726 family protein [Bacteroidia bacterium]